MSAGGIDALPPARRAALTATLAARLPDQRWYGDKGRPIAAVKLDDLVVAAADPAIALAIVRVRFTAGGDSRYLLPIAFAEARAGSPGVVAPAGNASPAIVDALTLPSFPRWLLDRIAAGAEMRGEHGRLRWDALPGAADCLARASVAPAVVLEAEQSNSAIRYGDALIVKLFRRLRDGVNPDVEIGRFLWRQTDFRNVPAPIATASYLPEAGGQFEIAFGQAFVPNEGDGWTWTLRQIAAMLALEEAERDAAIRRYAQAAAVLGQRTAALHRALVSRPDDPAFAPEPLTPERIRGWEDDLRRRLDAALNELAADPALPPAVAAMLPTLLRQRAALATRAAGFAAEAGDVAIRVHGDFHLGQVLRTGDDWTVLDFEGEPARPLVERRAKTSALKDVAGMLRSFAYARAAAGRADASADVARRAALAAWETAARAAFLAAYRGEIASAAVPIAPADAAAFRRACDAWELDKAVYEIAYERRNRPDWLEIPLAALLRLTAG